MTSPFVRNALPRGTSPTIRRRIITLVLLILLPLLGIFGWAAYNLAKARMEVIEAQRMEIATEIAARVDREMATAIGKLAGLALSVEPQTEGINAFQSDSRGLLAQPDFLKIWMFDFQGKTIVGSPSQPLATEPGELPPEMIRRTINGKVSVSEIRGTRAADARFVVAVPIIRKDTVAAGLAAEISTRMFDQVLSNVGLAEHWVAAVIDRTGTYAARSLDPHQWIGRKARPGLGMAARGAADAGTFENVTWENVRVLNSFRRSHLTGWTTTVAVPVSLVNAPLQKSAMLVILVGVSALGLTLLAAFAYARRISDPVSHLGRFARAFITGKTVAKPHFTLAELEEVRQTLETAAGESAHLAALVASSGDAIMSMDLNGVIRSWNPAAEQLFGYTAEEIIGKSKALLVPPESLDDYHRQMTEVASGQNVRSETVRMHRNGTPISVSVDAAPIRRPDGRIIGTSSILHDITERLANEDHRQFLMREVAHRSKNQLAIIQSIASQTARSSGTKADFLEQFKDRLQGLSASHDLLLKQDWRGAPLEELIRGQIETFVGDWNAAVHMVGPATILTATAAEAIGLALHELATNSAKYGALSVSGGKVDIAWKRVASDDGTDRWELSWRESGGPPVVPPKSTGFGTQVIKRMVGMAVKGETELSYAESGLVWKLTFPLTAMKPVSRQRQLASL